MTFWLAHNSTPPLRVSSLQTCPWIAGRSRWHSGSAPRHFPATIPGLEQSQKQTSGGVAPPSTRRSLADCPRCPRLQRKRRFSGHGFEVLTRVGPRKQLIDIAVGVGVDDPDEDVGEILERIDIVEFAGLDQ